MNLPDFLVAGPHDEITIRNTRVGLYHFVYDYNQGESAESIALQFPQIALATVHKVIAFYLENKAAVDDYAKRYAAELRDQRATGTSINLAELRERLSATPAAAR